jgi:hypothetical protein
MLVKLQRATADRLVSQASHKQHTGGWHKFMRLRGNAAGWIESSIEALGQFLKILLKAPSGGRVRWIGQSNLHHGRDQQPLDLCHSCRELHLLALAERFQKAMGKRIGSLIQTRSLTMARPGKSDVANSSVVLAHLNYDQVLPFE